MVHDTRFCGQGRHRRLFGQTLLRASVILALAATAGCAKVQGVLDNRVSGYAKGFGGAVAADEPQAVLVARDILAAGGSAADAVIAAYFTMSVTLPTAASLGAGGVCIVHDRARSLAEALDFTHLASGPFARRPAPIAPRAMQALHAKYGHLPWTQLLGPAEGLARLGYPASRALARSLAAAPGIAVRDPALAAIFARNSGNPVAEGERVQQFALAATLSQLRRQPTQFYTGSSARRIADDFTRSGMLLTAEELRGLVPRFRPVVTVSRGNQVAHFPPTAAGVVSAQAWALLYNRNLASDALGAKRALTLTEVSRRAYGDAGRWFATPAGVPDPVDAFVAEGRIDRLMVGLNLSRRSPPPNFGAGDVVEPVDLGSASVVASDVYGQSVACGFTMNGIMGAGRIAAETGIVMAAPPDPARAAAPVSLMILRNGTQHQMQFVGAATGGAVAPILLADTAAKVLQTTQSLETMLSAPRFYHPARPDRVVVEDRHDARPFGANLREAGYQVVTAPSLGRANAIACPLGLDGERSQCDARADRRAFGLAQQN